MISWARGTPPWRCADVGANTDSGLQPRGIRGLQASLLVLVALLVAPVDRAVATSTGLNNIPTADTPAHRQLVLQEISTFGHGRRPDFVGGFKTGLHVWRVRLEAGLDGRFAPDPAGPPLFQVKCAVAPAAGLPLLAVGVTNIGVSSDDRERAGQPFTFGVMTYDLTWFRVTGGYGLQRDGNAGFFGIDRTFRPFGRELILRADATQVKNQAQWLTSAGLLLSLTKYVALEAWVSQPSERGEPTITIKPNVILAF